MGCFLNILLLFVFIEASLCSECFYFPREFISHKEIEESVFENHECNIQSNNSDVTRWNDFVKTQENFLLLQHCVTYDGVLNIDKKCIQSIQKTFDRFRNRPLCSISTRTEKCIFKPLDACSRGEKAGPDSNIITFLCKTKSGYRESEHSYLAPLHLKSKYLHYYVAGSYDELTKNHKTKGPKEEVKAAGESNTLDITSILQCVMHESGTNCCNPPDDGERCNLPPLTRSFYAGVGPDQVAAAFANRPAPASAAAAAAASIHNNGGRDDTDGGGSWLSRRSHLTSLQLIGLCVAMLALVLLSLGACLTAVWLWHRRRRSGRAGVKASSDGDKDRLHVRAAAEESGNSKNNKEQRRLRSPTKTAAAVGAAPAGVAACFADPASSERLLPAASMLASTSSASSSSSGVFNSDSGFGGHHCQQRRALPPSSAAGSSSRGRGLVGSSSSSSGCGTSGTTVSLPPPPLSATAAAAANVADDSQTGSGAGLPILVPRTVAREVELRELIGQGRFGQVYRAVWRNDLVAVKIFNSRAESSWSTEGRMYELPGMRHDAILGFIATDNIDIGLETQLWLITDYHANGSLQSYLTRATVDQLTLARMANSIASGLSHLHAEITGVKCKPAIAHRDVKSNNILVKSDLTCCLADFGLAVACQQPGGDAAAAAAGTAVVGTRRYLSPECLLLDSARQQQQQAASVVMDFSGLRKADIYAMGLVFWELAVRCDDPERAVPAEPTYRQPYQGAVSANPSLEEMRRLVCEPTGARPELAPAWRSHPILGRLCCVMAECWYASPAARLEAMSVKDQTTRMLRDACAIAAGMTEDDHSGAEPMMTAGSAAMVAVAPSRSIGGGAMA